jgi:hypothetical protein
MLPSSCRAIAVGKDDGGPAVRCGLGAAGRLEPVGLQLSDIDQRVVPQRCHPAYRGREARAPDPMFLPVVASSYSAGG